MQLTISDVARLCNATENKVYQWVQAGGLPAKRINDLYRVNSAELLEWATTQKLPVSPAIFQKLNGDSVGQTGATDALGVGGVEYDVKGHDLGSILSAVVETLPLPDGFDRRSLTQLFLAREAMGGTAIGDGIAIPHPRSPVVLAGAQRVLRLCFLAQGVDMAAADGKQVDTLFLMICPTVHEHLQLLARLASVLRDESFRQTLRDKPSQDVILKEVRRVEISFQEST